MTILTTAWSLQHRAENWYHRPRLQKRHEDDSWSLGADVILTVGFGMIALGYLFFEVWWIIGGAMLFWMGIMTLEEEGPSDRSSS